LKICFYDVARIKVKVNTMDQGTNQKTGKFRYVIIGILFFIILINYIDRASISYAIDDIAQLFNLNSAEVGWVLGCFGLGYAVTTFFGGIVVDRYGSKAVLAISVLLWSFSLVGTGLAFNFSMLLIFRTLLGVMEGPNFPAMTLSLKHWASKKERAKVISMDLVAVPISLALGGPIVTLLIHYTSWRWMFVVLGCVGLLWIPLWLWLFTNKPQSSKHVSKAELEYINAGNDGIDNDLPITQACNRSTKNYWAYFFTTPTMLVNYLAFFVFGYYLFFFMTWLPSYLIHKYHFDVTQTGMFTVLPWLLAAGFMWFTGILADRIYHRTGKLRLARSWMIMISQLLAMLCVICLLFASNIGQATLFISLAVAFTMSTNALYYAINIDLASKKTGTALGIMNTAFAISGFLAPVLTGALVNSTGNYDAGFILMIILALLSVVLCFFFHHPDKEKVL